MTKHSKLGYVLAAFVLLGGLTFGGVALSQKPPAPITVATSGGQRLCENPAVAEKAHKVVAAAIETGRWTKADHEQLRPLFHQLKTEQKVELLRKIAAAKKLTIDKGTPLLFW
jgi:hypothetical protein